MTTESAVILARASPRGPTVNVPRQRISPSTVPFTTVVPRKIHFPVIVDASPMSTAILRRPPRRPQSFTIVPVRVARLDR